MKLNKSMFKFCFTFLISISIFFNSQAVTYYVNSSTGNDGNAGTIGAPYKTFHKAYTSCAASGDVIQITGTVDWTSANETGDAATSGYTISKSITISGAGASSAIIQAASTKNTADRRVFTISNGYSVTISNLTIKNGKASDGGGLNLAGSSSNLTINDCEVLDNYSTNNYGGAIYANYGTFVSNNSTFSGNNVLYWGAVIYSYYGVFTFTNCTITANSGYSVVHTIFGSGNINLTNNTIAYNTINTNWTNTIYIETGGYTLNFQNNLIVENKNGTTPRDLTTGGSTMGNVKNNIIETTGTGITNGTNGNIVGSSTFGLSNTLALNGASNVRTLSINCFSVAVNSGINTTNGPISVPTSDQRGVSRVGTVDIGSFENSGSSEITQSGTLSSFSKCGSSASASQSFTVQGCNLTNNITITAPTGFEVSTSSSSGYASTLTLTQTSGSVASTTVYVRLTAVATGSPSGNISLTSTGATTVNIAVSGTVGTAAAGTPSTDQIVCYNTNATDVTLSGSSGTIVWQSSTDKSSWSTIAGATSTTLTGAQIGALTTTKYVRAQVTSGSCTETSTTVTLRVNNGLQFDGTSDFVDVGLHSALNFTSNFTIEAWVYVPASPKASINTIFSKNYPNHGTPGYMFGFNEWNTTNLYLVFEDGASAIRSTKKVVAGAWNHTAIVVSNSGTLGTFYLNGVEAGSSAVTLTNASAVNEYIGAMNSGASYSLQGTLDELRIWSVARSQSDLINNMDNNLTGSEANLVAYYDFDQGIPSGTNTSISTVLDRTTNAFNGTLTNFGKSGSTSNFIGGNHLSVVSPESIGCNGSTAPRLYYGNTGKVASTLQWYSNSSASTSGATLISGATSNYYDAPTNVSGTRYYYVVATGTCAAVSNSNFASVVVEDPTISGNSYLYLGHNTTFTTTVTAAASTPWSSSSTATATINSSGVITPVAAGTSTITFNSALGCTSTKSIQVVPVEWTGSTNTTWSNPNNWIGQYVPTTLTNVSVSSSASNDIQLDANYTITNLTFNGSNKKIILGNYDLTVSSITGADANNYVKTSGTGTMKINIASSGTKSFAVGNSSYNPVSVTNNTGSSDVFSVRLLNEVYSHGTTGTVLTTPRVTRTWLINKTNANSGSGVNFVFNWNAGETSGTITTPKLYHYGTSWQKQTGTTSSTANSLTYTGYTGTFSPFAIGDDVVLLPVNWLHFDCSKQNAQGTELNWSTASEGNSKRFVVERSQNGQAFLPIGEVPAAGYSHSIRQYTFTDPSPLKTRGYYRIAMEENNGNREYSTICMSNSRPEAENSPVKVYPNPSNGTINIHAVEGGTYQISDMSGRLVSSGKLDNHTQIDGLMPGIYSLNIQTGDDRYTQKLVVE